MQTISNWVSFLFLRPDPKQTHTINWFQNKLFPLYALLLSFKAYKFFFVLYFSQNLFFHQWRPNQQNLLQRRNHQKAQPILHYLRPSSGIQLNFSPWTPRATINLFESWLSFSFFISLQFLSLKNLTLSSLFVSFLKPLKEFAFIWSNWSLHHQWWQNCWCYKGTDFQSSWDRAKSIKVRCWRTHNWSISKFSDIDRFQSSACAQKIQEIICSWNPDHSYAHHYEGNCKKTWRLWLYVKGLVVYGLQHLHKVKQYRWSS